MTDEGEELAPKEQSLFPLKAEDILENAFQNLDPSQAKAVSKKAADELVRLEVEKRLAEHRSESARDEIRNVIESANMLDQRGGDYKISSSFETATGTTNVEINRSKTSSTLILVVIAGVVFLALALLALLFRY